MKPILDPEESRNIDAYMGDVMKYVALDFRKTIGDIPSKHRVEPNDIAFVASARIRALAT
jgi:hypothetical protein